MTSTGSKTAIIVGTGATRGSGYSKNGFPLPGDRGFFGHDLVKSQIDKYRALEILFGLFGERGNHYPEQASLEEVWTFVEFLSKGVYSNLYDLKNERTEWIRRTQSAAPYDEEHCLSKVFREQKTIPTPLERIDMTLLAGWDLRLLLSDVYRGVTAPSQNVFQQFIENHGISCDGNTTFISLNYDTVLEYALSNIDGCRWFYPHIQTSIPRDNGGMRVLKPHGSLNWLFQGNEPSVRITTDYRLNPVSHKCWDTNRFEEAAIVPPTQLKQKLNMGETEHGETIFLFTKIWSDMARALVAAEEVFIIGYSFPSTDHHFRTLLRLANKMRTKVYDKVCCCTKAEGGLEGAVFANAVRFFPCEQGHHLSDAGFEAFAKGI